MKRLFLLLLLMFGLNLAQSQTPLPKVEQVLLVKPGESNSRQFGDLVINYTLASRPIAVQCTLFVSSQFVGIRTLSALSPIYKFDVQVGLSKATGSVTLLLANPDLVSTLAGSFSYTANSTSFVFKGDIVGWYIKQ